MDYNIPFIKGNTARVFFEKYEQVAKILEVPEFLVHDLGIMWEAVVSGVPIDPEKFGNFCELFVAKFSVDKTISWYQFSPTLHKIMYDLHNSTDNSGCFLGTILLKLWIYQNVSRIMKIVHSVHGKSIMEFFNMPLGTIHK